MSNSDKPEGGVPQRFWRSPTEEACKHIAEKANLEHEAGVPDWPLEHADSERTGEFIELLNAATDSDVRFVLMELVLFSLDECDKATQREHWPGIAKILESAPKEHAYSLIYWGCARQYPSGRWDLNPKTGETFSITPRVQAVLRKVKDEIGFDELE